MKKSDSLKLQTGCGDLILVKNYDKDNKLNSISIKFKKTGSCHYVKKELAIGYLNLAIKTGLDKEELEKLEKLHCPCEPCCIAVVAKALK